MKNVAFKMIGTTLVAVYNDQTPTTEEHRKCLEVFRLIDPDKTRALIVTDGGAPTPVQRKDFVEVLQGRTYWMAVCTDSVMVRGVVTAVGWFTRKTKAFPKSGLDDALRFLDVSAGQAARLRDEVQALMAEVKRA